VKKLLLPLVLLCGWSATGGLAAAAENQKVAAKEVAAARTYLDGIFAFCTGDWHWVGVYNGSPEEWGDDGFYDRWRGEMRRHALAIAERLKP
jgi:hypothetical protein